MVVGKNKVDGVEGFDGKVDSGRFEGMKFRKKPVVIDAEQFFESAKPLPFQDKQACNLGPDGWYVVTIHGQETKIVDGDWIIPEPDGIHFYPCKNDIFEATYEPV